MNETKKPLRGQTAGITAKIGNIPCGTLWIKNKKERLPMVGEKIVVFGQSRKEFHVQVDRIQNGYYYHLVDLDGKL